MEPAQPSQDLQDIKLTLALILANQKTFLERFDEHIKEDKEIATRVTSIEKTINWGMGALGAVALIGPYLLGKLGLR